MESFKKQIYEEFGIAADFSNVMDSSTPETIVSQTVEAIDKDGVDVGTTILDQATVGNDGAMRATVLVRAGTEEASPYKITFKCVTSDDHKWELEVKMIVSEI